MEQNFVFILAGVGVLVDVKSDAIAFYEKLGFLRLEATAGELGDRPPTSRPTLP
jgi:hypothetical protein